MEPPRPPPPPPLALPPAVALLLGEKEALGQALEVALGSALRVAEGQREGWGVAVAVRAPVVLGVLRGWEALGEPETSAEADGLRVPLRVAAWELLALPVRESLGEGVLEVEVEVEGVRVPLTLALALPRELREEEGVALVQGETLRERLGVGVEEGEREAVGGREALPLALPPPGPAEALEECVELGEGRGERVAVGEALALTQRVLAMVGMPVAGEVGGGGGGGGGPGGGGAVAEEPLGSALAEAEGVELGEGVSLPCPPAPCGDGLALSLGEALAVPAYAPSTQGVGLALRRGEAEPLGERVEEGDGRGLREPEVDAVKVGESVGARVAERVALNVRAGVGVHKEDRDGRRLWEALVLAVLLREGCGDGEGVRGGEGEGVRLGEGVALRVPPPGVALPVDAAVLVDEGGTLTEMEVGGVEEGVAPAPGEGVLRGLEVAEGVGSEEAVAVPPPSLNLSFIQHTRTVLALLPGSALPSCSCAGKGLELPPGVPAIRMAVEAPKGWPSPQGATPPPPPTPPSKYPAL